MSTLKLFIFFNNALSDHEKNLRSIGTIAELCSAYTSKTLPAFTAPQAKKFMYWTIQKQFAVIEKATLDLTNALNLAQAALAKTTNPVLTDVAIRTYSPDGLVSFGMVLPSDIFNAMTFQAALSSGLLQSTSLTSDMTTSYFCQGDAGLEEFKQGSPEWNLCSILNLQ
jgi:hypothetical protein